MAKYSATPLRVFASTNARTWAQVVQAPAAGAPAAPAPAGPANNPANDPEGIGWAAVLKAKQQERKLAAGDLQETAAVLEELQMAYKQVVKQKEALEATVRLQAAELEANAARREDEVVELEKFLHNMRLSSHTPNIGSPPADAKPDSPANAKSTEDDVDDVGDPERAERHECIAGATEDGVDQE